MYFFSTTILPGHLILIYEFFSPGFIFVMLWFPILICVQYALISVCLMLISRVRGRTRVRTASTAAGTKPAKWTGECAGVPQGILGITVWRTQWFSGCFSRAAPLLTPRWRVWARCTAGRANWRPPRRWRSAPRRTANRYRRFPTWRSTYKTWGWLPVQMTHTGRDLTDFSILLVLPLSHCLNGLTTLEIVSLCLSGHRCH